MMISYFIYSLRINIQNACFISYKQNKHMLQYFGIMFLFSFSVFLIIP